MRESESIESLADVQRLLLPDNPRIRGVEFAVHYQPADVAAGDYYDLMSLTHLVHSDAESLRDAWGLMVADVSGHGPAAAMEAVQFDAILRTYRGDEPPGGPAGALTYANRYFFSRRPRRHFLTAFSALCEPDRQLLTFVSAGHPPAFRRRGATVSRIGERGDIPLGVLREHSYANESIELVTGDVIVAYTDGLVEATDTQGDAFGIERVAAIIANAPPSAVAIMQALRDAMIAHQGRPIGRDDQTILAIQQLPVAGVPGANNAP